MLEDFKNMNLDELDGVTGGAAKAISNSSMKVVKNLQSGWLALRSEPTYDYKNEIGKLYNGDKVQIIGTSKVGTDGRVYVQVSAPKLNKKGWVNAGFIG